MNRFSNLVAMMPWVCLLPMVANGQGPRNPQEALRTMFEQMGKQADQFVPGMFSELDPKQMAELEKIPISPREESQFGEQVLKSYEASLKTQNISITRTPDNETIGYLTELVGRVRPLMTNARRYARIDIALVQTDSIDAYSVPGGHLLFTNGLMKNVESEAELVGVIGHELSHLDRGHQLLQLKQAKRVNRLSDFRSSMQWLSTMVKPFRPEFESQADADAVRWMIASGYDPRQLARLLSRWDARQDKQAPWTNMMPSFVRSHPDSGRRAETVLRDFEKTNIDPDTLVVGRENLENLTPSDARKRP